MKIKKKDVEVGRIYVAKISGKLAPVKIMSRRPVTHTSSTGWFAVNLDTRKRILIKSHTKLRLDITPSRIELMSSGYPIMGNDVGIRWAAAESRVAVHAGADDRSESLAGGPLDTAAYPLPKVVRTGEDLRVAMDMELGK